MCTVCEYIYKLNTGSFSLSVGVQLDPEQTGFIAVENFTSLAEHHELQLDPSKLEMLLALVQSNEHGHVCYQELLELVSSMHLTSSILFIWTLRNSLCLQVTMMIKLALLRKIAPTSQLDLLLINAFSMCKLVMGYMTSVFVTYTSIFANTASQWNWVTSVMTKYMWNYMNVTSEMVCINLETCNSHIYTIYIQL